MTNNHEKILIQGLKEGNTRIYDYIFHYYYSGMVVFALKYINKKEIAEDIVQDFFVKLWIKREKIEIKSSLKSYFFTSLKNSCIDYLRKNDANTNSISSPVEILKNLSLTEERDLLIESELREKINAAIDKLPATCKEVFIMNRFENLKAAEIAKKRGISVRTVETHIGKALKILKKELSGYSYHSACC
jgi:RNA polymerase sigma-70 factor (ECF subfamily)